MGSGEYFELYYWRDLLDLLLGEWGMLNWTLGVCKFLIRLGCKICLFISSVFWFWLCCLALLRSCWRGGIYYILVRFVVRLEMLGELMVLVVRTTVRVFLQISMDYLEKRSVLMIGGLFVWLFVGVVGGSRDVVGRDWCGACWLAILEKIQIIYLRGNFVFVVIFCDKKD